MKILVTICARGGSKGIPGKNLKYLSGKPLIQYTIELTNKLKLELNWDIKVSLSTDDLEIKKVVQDYIKNLYDVHLK